MTTINPPAENELILIRHAPVSVQGHLFGRSDVAATLPQAETLVRLRAFLEQATTRISSPALRCRDTAAALWPGETVSAEDPRLWEQDFGAWEGQPFADLPDIGPRSGNALAAHRPPGGESFDDVCARAWPALLELAEKPGARAAVVHAGIVRACIALAISSPANALRFEVEPLSVSRFRALPDGTLTVHSVNARL